VIIETVGGAGVGVGPTVGVEVGVGLGPMVGVKVGVTPPVTVEDGGTPRTVTAPFTKTLNECRNNSPLALVIFISA